MIGNLRNANGFMIVLFQIKDCLLNISMGFLGYFIFCIQHAKKAGLKEESGTNIQSGKGVQGIYAVYNWLEYRAKGVLCLKISMAG